MRYSKITQEAGKAYISQLELEIVNVLNQNPYGVKVTIAQVQQLIELFDTNTNGLLEFGEFEKLIEDALKRIP